MKKLELKPYEFECTLAEAPAGMFVHNGLLGIKTTIPAKNDNATKEVFNPDGTLFWAGTSGFNERDALKVVPVYQIWFDV
jgi:hypothetical protein